MLEKYALLLSLSLLTNSLLSPHVLGSPLKISSAIAQKYPGKLFAGLLVASQAYGAIGQLQKRIKALLGLKQFTPAPSKNLHVTLQLLDRLVKNDTLKKIDQVLQAVSKKEAAVRLSKQVQYKVTISKNGTVKLALPPLSKLTQLAKLIRRGFTQAHIKQSSRFDFPSQGHITLGKIGTQFVDSAKKKLAIAAVKIDIPSFKMSDITLLKSNNPAAKRDYARIKKYPLKG